MASKNPSRKVRARPRRRKGGAGAPALHASVAQMRALAHPLRLRVLELFAEEPRTTMQVAGLLGEPPTRLYHHVNALERVGLLRLRETRPNRGTTEKWYEAVAQGFQPAPARSARAGARTHAVTGLGVMVFEQARRELATALHDPRGARPLAGRLVAVGSPAHIARVRARVQEFLLELRRELPSEVPARGAARSARPARELERWALTFAFAPAWPRSRR